MLSLLLDENISPEVAIQVQQSRPDIRIARIHTWQQGRLVSAPDEVILAEASAAGLTLVTYDQRTISPLLVSWGHRDIGHSGVIFVDDRTVGGDDLGALVRSLIAHWDVYADQPTENCVWFLRQAA